MSPIPTSEFPHPYALVKKKNDPGKKGASKLSGLHANRALTPLTKSFSGQA